MKCVVKCAVKCIVVKYREYVKAWNGVCKYVPCAHVCVRVCMCVCVRFVQTSVLYMY